MSNNHPNRSMTAKAQHPTLGLHPSLHAPITSAELLALCAERDALRAENAALREALAPLIAVEERKLASLEKRPYSIGVETVRQRLATARAALARVPE